MALKFKILITGLPGCGKTTLFKSLAMALLDLRPAGFYTEEIRESGVRRGFALRGLNGKEGVLAHVDFARGHRIGKYGVDVAGFDAFLDAIHLNRPDTGLIMIDEIGKMECLSRQFQRMVRQFLDSDRMLIATVAWYGGGLIADIKNRTDVLIYTLTAQNRDRMPETILTAIQLSNTQP